MGAESTSGFRIVRDDRARVASLADSWLRRDEAVHNLPLSLLPRLREDRPDDYLAVVERSEEVVGCAFRTPPFKLGLTSMPIAAIEPLAEDVASVYDTLPSAFGPEGVAVAFGDAWVLRRHGSFEQGLRMRLHRLDRVIPPARRAPGQLRAAQERDQEKVFEWAEAFARETKSVVLGRRDRTQAVFRQGEFYVWEVEGELRSMAAALGATARGVRIGYVYTPQEHRSKGYATTAVADLSNQLLHSGREFCILYTDLANPTSNEIYASIGYKALTDVMDVVFES